MAYFFLLIAPVLQNVKLVPDVALYAVLVVIVYLAMRHLFFNSEAFLTCLVVVKGPEAKLAGGVIRLQ